MNRYLTLILIIALFCISVGSIAQSTKEAPKAPAHKYVYSIKLHNTNSTDIITILGGRLISTNRYNTNQFTGTLTGGFGGFGSGASVSNGLGRFNINNGHGVGALMGW